jgi:hypothetical protein
LGGAVLFNEVTPSILQITEIRETFVEMSDISHTHCYQAAFNIYIPSLCSASASASAEVKLPNLVGVNFSSRIPVLTEMFSYDRMLRPRLHQVSPFFFEIDIPQSALVSFGYYAYPLYKTQSNQTLLQHMFLPCCIAYNF